MLEYLTCLTLECLNLKLLPPVLEQLPHQSYIYETFPAVFCPQNSQFPSEKVGDRRSTIIKILRFNYRSDCAPRWLRGIPIIKILGKFGSFLQTKSPIKKFND